MILVIEDTQSHLSARQRSRLGKKLENRAIQRMGRFDSEMAEE